MSRSRRQSTTPLQQIIQYFMTAGLVEMQQAIEVAQAIVNQRVAAGGAQAMPLVRPGPRRVTTMMGTANAGDPPASSEAKPEVPPAAPRQRAKRRDAGQPRGRKKSAGTGAGTAAGPVAAPATRRRRPAVVPAAAADASTSIASDPMPLPDQTVVEDAEA